MPTDDLDPIDALDPRHLDDALPNSARVRVLERVIVDGDGARLILDAGGAFRFARTDAIDLVSSGRALPVDGEQWLLDVIPKKPIPMKQRTATSEPAPPPPSGVPLRLSTRDGEHVRPARHVDKE